MPPASRPRSFRTLADGLLEAPIITSFTNIGYSARKRLHHWAPLASYDLTGKVVVLTGASTGIGYAAAHEFASLGATLVMISRSADRIERAADETRRFTGNPDVVALAADMGKQLAEISLDPIGGTPQSVSDVIRADSAMYGQIIKQAGIEPQ